jgi:hypothetical protein
MLERKPEKYIYIYIYTRNLLLLIQEPSELGNALSSQKLLLVSLNRPVLGLMRANLSNMSLEIYDILNL